MSKASPGITAFNAGELSPRLDGRTDLEKYSKGCRTLENFLPLVQGGAMKRSGTRFVREPTRTILQPQVFSEIFSLSASGIDVRTGYGFSPKAAVVFSTQIVSASTVLTGANIHPQVSFLTAENSKLTHGKSLDASGTSSVSMVMDTGYAAAALDAGGIFYDGSTTAVLTADGITFTCTNAYAITSPKVSVWALGGASIRGAEAIVVDCPSGPGNVVISTVNSSLRPDFAIFSANGVTTVGFADTTNMQFSMGMCDSDGNQGAVVYSERGSVNPANTASHASSTECFALGSGGAGVWTPLAAASVVGFSGNTLTINFSSSLAAGTKINVLLVDSQATLRVRSFATPSGTGAFSPITGLPGQPRGAFFASACVADAAGYTAGAGFSMAARAASTGSLQAMASTHGVTPTETAYRVNTGAQVWNQMTAATPTITGSIDFSAFGAASVDLNCTTASSGKLVLAALALDRGSITNLPAIVPFKFSEDDAYILEFNDLTMIPYRNGFPVLETAQSITAVTKANPAVVTSVAHGYVDNNEVYISSALGMLELNGRFMTIDVLTADTYALVGVNSTGYGTYTGGGTAARVYKITTPYPSSALSSLNSWAGQNDVMYIAHPDYPPQKVSRFDHANWTIAAVAFDYFPFAPENTDESSYVSATSATGLPTITASAPIFSSGSVGSYLKLREVIASNNAKWKLGIDFSASYLPWSATGAGGMNIGEHCYFEDKVYELLHKHSGANTGNQEPVHEEGNGFDGRWEWSFYNYGFGYVRIDSVTDAHRAQVTVVVPLPLSVVSNNIVITGTTAANPVVVTTIVSHLYETGDKVFIRGVVTADELNDQVYVVTRLSATTFSIPVNGTTFGAGTSGTTTRMYSGPQLVNTAVRPVSMFRWSWGAWDAVRGYPRAVVFFEDRLVWAGTNANPQTAWASVTGDYEDHRTFDADDSALVWTLASSEPVEWMVNQSALVMGTRGDESGTNRNATDPLAPGTVSAIRTRSHYGSRSGVRPVAVENVILIVQRSGRKLRELKWDDLQDALVASDLTRLADHVTLPLIAGMDFQGEPDRLLWCFLDDGQLLAFTYERDEQVFGWHRHPLGGSGIVRDLAVIPHPDGDGDQLWMVVQRTIGADVHTFVEVLEKQWIRTGVIADAYFLDAGGTYSGAPATVIRGLWHLVGETVAVLADGLYVGTQVVSATGTVTLTVAASTVSVGYPYDATVAPMRLEAGGADGTAQGKVKRITNVVLRLDQTGTGLYLGATPQTATQIVPLTAGQLYDGDTKLLAFPGRYDFGGLIALKHTQPLPCTITAILPTLVTQDR